MSWYLACINCLPTVCRRQQGMSNLECNQRWTPCVCVDLATTKAARPTGQPARRGPMQGRTEQSAMATDLAGRGRTGAGGPSGALVMARLDEAHARHPALEDRRRNRQGLAQWLQ